MDILNNYWVGEKNYFNVKTTKTRIIIGSTQTNDLGFINAWNFRWGGNYKKTHHFTITNDGELFQHFSTDFYSKFTGISEIDKETISICLVNPGWLSKDNLNNVWMDQFGNIIDVDENTLIKKTWRNKTYWTIFSEKQINKLNELIDYLCEKHEIEKNIVDHNTFILNKDEFWSVSVRPNYLYYSTDIGASFPFKELTKNE